MEPVLLGKIVVFVRMAEGGRLNLNSWTWACRRAAMFLALLVTSGLRLKTTSRDMEARLRVCERALQNLVVDWRIPGPGSEIFMCYKESYSYLHYEVIKCYHPN